MEHCWYYSHISSLNFFNGVVWNGLVAQYPIISDVWYQNTYTLPFATRSVIKKSNINMSVWLHNPQLSAVWHQTTFNAISDEEISNINMRFGCIIPNHLLFGTNTPTPCLLQRDQWWRNYLILILVFGWIIPNHLLFGTQTPSTRSVMKKYLILIWGMVV